MKAKSMKLYQKFLNTNQFRILIECLDRFENQNFKETKSKIRLKLMNLIFNRSLYLNETFVPYVEIHKIFDNFYEYERFSKSIQNRKINSILKNLKTKLKEISKNGLIQI